MSIRSVGAIGLASILVLAACTPTSTPTPPPSAPPTASPTPTATASVASGPRELAAGVLPAGTYTRSGFVPPITFAIDDGWVGGTVTDGFFDVQQNAGTPGVIAVQFALVDSVVGADAAMIPATTAAAAIDAVKKNPGVAVLGESGSRLGGRDGFTIEVENTGTITRPVMEVAPGRLAFDPGRRLWISFFDTSDGLLAVLVGGSAADWGHALEIAEPVLESVVIGGATP